MAIKKKKKSARQATRTKPSKKTSSLRKAVPAKKTKQPQRRRPSGTPNVTLKTLDALNERFDMILPEVMFRIAAIEHILVKNQLCSYDDLVNARQFIQEQEGS